MALSKSPSLALLNTCKALQIRHEKDFMFNFKGHDIDLSSCGDKPLQVLHFIAKTLSERLTKFHIESWFGKKL